MVSVTHRTSLMYRTSLLYRTLGLQLASQDFFRRL